MDEPERSVRRVQMGRSVQPLVAAAGPGASGGVEDGYWYFLSGAPSPDANIVLVLEPEALGPALGVTRASELSVMVMVAPSAAGAAPGDGWTHVGSMPLMAADLGAIPLAVDARVRTAGAGDRGDLGAILAEAYDMDRSVADRFTAVAGGAVPGLHFWLLEEGSEARSVVLSSIVGDAVCIWCMGTPKRFGRRGFGRSLLGHVLLEATRAGATTGLLGATPEGRPLYESTGWSVVEPWELFLDSPSVQSDPSD